MHWRVLSFLLLCTSLLRGPAQATMRYATASGGSMPYPRMLCNWLLAWAVLLSGVVMAPAATYYVATTGSNGNTCTAAQTIGTPKQTLASVIPCLATAGDTVNIRAGTYTETISVGLFGASGTSYASALTVQAHPGETVTLNGDITMSSPGTGVTRQYIIFKGLIVRGVAYIGGGSNGGTINHIKFDGLTVGGASSGSTVDDYRVTQIGGDDGTGTDSWITNTVIQHCANTTSVNGCHGVYVQTNNNIVENTEINNTDGYGIHNYGEGGNAPSSNIYRNLYIHNTGGKVSQIQWGIGIEVGSSNLAYNNLVINNQEGIHLGPAGNFAYNNTLYGNGVGYGGECCFAALKLDAASTARNTISFGNAIDTPSNTGGTVSHTITSNPSFVNTSGDAAGFAIPSTSTAKDAGTDLSGTFTTDYVGTTRPQGSSWDVGAFEVIETLSAPTLLSVSMSTPSFLSAPTLLSVSMSAPSVLSAPTLIGVSMSAPSFLSAPTLIGVTFP